MSLFFLAFRSLGYGLETLGFGVQRLRRPATAVNPKPAGLKP